jgi:hypothetical protein
MGLERPMCYANICGKTRLNNAYWLRSKQENPDAHRAEADRPTATEAASAAA